VICKGDCGSVSQPVMTERVTNTSKERNFFIGCSLLVKIIGISYWFHKPLLFQNTVNFQE
jgi:hypothetical protein